MSAGRRTPRAAHRDRRLRAVWNHFGAATAWSFKRHPATSTAPSPAVPSNASRALGTVTGEGFVCTIFEDSDGRSASLPMPTSTLTAPTQAGGPAAYKVDDVGSEALANGGMRMQGGKVVCAQPWARDIVILGAATSRRCSPATSSPRDVVPRARKGDRRPDAYVDAETVPYTPCRRCGCSARRGSSAVAGSSDVGGRSVDCVVADRGRPPISES